MLCPTSYTSRAQRHLPSCSRPLVGGNGLRSDVRCRGGNATMAPTSSQGRSTSWQNLAQWIANDGGRVEGIDLADCRMGAATVRGIVATQPFEQGDTVMAIPRHMILRDKDCPPPYPGAPWNIAMACRLIKERAVLQLDPNARTWAKPYLDMLPTEKEHLTPLAFTTDEVAAIQYQPAMRAVNEYKEAVQAAHASLQTEGYDFSYEDVAWGMTTVQSRALRIPSLEARVMLPGIDLLNHGGSQCNVALGTGNPAWNVLEDSEAAIHVIAKTHIEPGQQVLWSYGDRSNDDFFVYHGFSLSDNTFDDIVLFEDIKDLAVWFHSTFIDASSKPTSGQSYDKPASPWKISPPSSQSWASLPVPDIGSEQAKADAIQRLLQELEPLAATVRKNACADCQEAHKPGTADTVLICMRTARAGAHRALPQRVLRPFRLHYSDWGAGDCRPDMPELLVRADGMIDCRLAAAMEKLHDRFMWGSRKLPTWQSVVAVRCQELLDNFPTSLGEDKLLLGAGKSHGGFGMALQYRKHKKEVLHRVLECCKGL